MPRRSVSEVAVAGNVQWMAEADERNCSRVMSLEMLTGRSRYHNLDFGHLRHFVPLGAVQRWRVVAHSRWRGVSPSTRRGRSCLCAYWGCTFVARRRRLDAAEIGDQALTGRTSLL